MEEFQLSITDWLYAIQLTKFKARSSQVTNTSFTSHCSHLSVINLFLSKDRVMVSESVFNITDEGICSSKS